MKPYVNIPVELARQIAQDFDKQFDPTLILWPIRP